MSFEWDEAKRQRNLQEHNVDFIDVFPLFDGDTIDRFDYGESRIRSLGQIDGRGAKTAASSARERRMPESKENIVRVTAEEARAMKGETDYARLDAMTDEDIARAVAEDPDACPVDADWSDASLVVPPQMRDSVLFVDDDVLAWFRAGGEGFRARMKTVLRAYMEAHQRKPG
jgi:uncharacterized protein (DUF4415 family)